MRHINNIIIAIFVLLPLLLLAGAPAAADPPVRVVTTLEVLADLARRVGGDRVSVEALARGYQDPHYVDPTPALMASVRDADLFVEIGLQLEIWSTRILDGAGNPNVRPGMPGHVYASDGVERLERPSSLSRTQGDLHPDGNPHIWMDPLNAIPMAQDIRDGLKRVDPEGSDAYDRNFAQFVDELHRALYGPELVQLFGERAGLLDRLTREGHLTEVLGQRTYEGRPLLDRLGGWMARARPLQGQPVVFYHSQWPYFAARFGIRIVGHVEERPGIEPGPAYLQDLVQLMRNEHVRVLGRVVYFPEGVCRQCAEEAGAVVVDLPSDVNGVPEASDYFRMMGVVIDRLVAAVER